MSLIRNALALIFHPRRCREEYARWELYRRLDHSAVTGDTAEINRLLDLGLSPNGDPWAAPPPLERAIYSRDIAPVRLLLERGASPNARESEYCVHSPLNHAVSECNVTLARLLLEYGADVNAPEPDRKPLMIAAALGKLDMISFLLEMGADIHAQDKTGMTALTNAVVFPQMSGEVVEEIRAFHLLRERGAPVRALDAVALGDTQRAKALSEREPASSRAPQWGHYQLSYAAQQGDIRRARLLLECGADPNIPYDRRTSLLRYARLYGKTEMVALLRQHGAR